MKKNIAKLLVLVIAISLFSGCANKNKIGDELKTIKLWSGYCMIAEDELEMEKSEWILTKLVDKYNEIQDDIRVEFSYFDDDDVVPNTSPACHSRNGCAYKITRPFLEKSLYPTIPSFAEITHKEKRSLIRLIK